MRNPHVSRHHPHNVASKPAPDNRLIFQDYRAKSFLICPLMAQIRTVRYSGRQECNERGLTTAPIKVRLIRVVLPDGTIEVLITSLIDTEEYPCEEFAGLYHLRWAQEENYKVIKCRVEMANWTGRSALSVKHDFHARTMAAKLTASLVLPAQNVVDIVHADDIKPKQVNKTYALSAMKDALVRLLTAVKPLDLLRSLISLFSRTVETIRIGRSYERRKDIKPASHYISYKSCL